MKLLILTLCVAYAFADVSHILKPIPRSGSPEQNAEIIKQENDNGFLGDFRWGFETSNGIVSSAQGQLKNPESENAAQEVQGGSSWTDPNGEKVEINYLANENGYQVQGSHIPTPPPIPEAILRALEYIRAHPARENK